MFFIPIAILLFLAFVLSLPFLLLLAYFQVIVVGFSNLGISPHNTIIILFLILMGSLINIPLTRKERVVAQQSRGLFGLFSVPVVETNYLAINVGGAVIPILLSFYFLYQIYVKGFALKPLLIAVGLMIIVCRAFSKAVPGRGVMLPALIPPIFSAIFAMMLTPGFAAATAFISGVLGSLIGADLLNLWQIRKYGGLLSIGGAGVFDGIFLVGIVSALLSGL